MRSKPNKNEVVLFGVGILTNIFITVFGEIIPNTVTGFFKEMGSAVIFGVVLVFAFTWYMKARPHNTPKAYNIIVFDVNSQQIQIDGIRTEFRNHDVAWSFMKQYKADYPMFNFAMVADSKDTDKKTIFRYI
ncbi:MAG: hypothetical protein EB150_05915 [Nitrososphaeria archaeon]|nr:hypothetical protein [Nitrososphaeria archaeon]NDB63296.1 hypothetical protein [Nitrosopumilaceae archaeon]NDF29728.1 hypothetical protein [Nitrososphaeria archaeon]